MAEEAYPVLIAMLHNGSIFINFMNETVYYKIDV